LHCFKAKCLPPRPLSNLLRESLDSPIAERRIEELKGEKAVILVDDYTRSTPAKEIIPEVAERLKKVVKGACPYSPPRERIGG